MRTPLATLFLTALLLSGCLGIGLKDAQPEPTNTVPKGEVLDAGMIKARGIVGNLTCDPSAAASATSANLKLLGSFKTPINVLNPSSAPGQIDTLHNRTAIAFPNSQQFVVANTSDPTRPTSWNSYTFALGGSIQFLGDPRNYLPSTNNFDVQFNDDGSNVVAAVNNRLYAMDVTLRFPRFNFQGGYLDLPPDYGGQAYRIAVETVGNRQYVFVAPGATGTGMFVAALSGTAQFAKLEAVGMMTFPSGAAGRLAIQPQDLFLKTEFISGGNHTLMYAANGAGGLLVLDVNTPLRPEIVATIPMPTPAPNSLPSAITSIAVAHINGKRIVAASQTGPQSALRIWDMTDFKQPKALASWTLDPSKSSQPQAEINVVGSTLFLTHFEQGLWGFNLTKLVETPSEGLKPILHYQPPTGGSLLDVSIEEGIIQVADAGTQTLQLIGYGCFVPGEKKLNSAD